MCPKMVNHGQATRAVRSLPVGPPRSRSTAAKGTDRISASEPHTLYPERRKRGTSLNPQPRRSASLLCNIVTGSMQGNLKSHKSSSYLLCHPKHEYVGLAIQGHAQ